MSMALNPEAPEFLPALNSCIQKGFATMNTTIKLSNNLPVYVAYKQYKSVTDFNIVTQRFNHNVIYQLNSIFVTELSSFRLKEDEYEYNMERLIDANDSVLDRIYSNVDCVDKGVEPNQQNDNKVMGLGPYCRPIITTIQVGNTMLTTAKNIPRPQILFKDTIDNSSALWMPKITDKPNNIKPLALEMLYNNNGEPIGFEHPYETELSLFQPQAHWLVPYNEPPILPPPVDQTKMTFICTEELVDELIRHLETVEVLGVDLEHHSYRSYQGFTCLVQISTEESDFIIDAIAVREHLYKLNEIFTNPKKLKVFHGADMDIQWLQRDFGVYVVGLFDTHQAACALNLNGRSLAALVKRYCALYVDKSFQLADWRLRPLTEDMVRYARTDTHYLPYIWRRMRADLLMADNGNPQILLSVFESSRQICGITYSKQVTDEKSHMGLYLRSKRVFNARQMAALRLLYRWRDEAARSMDESTMYLLPNHQLVSLAEHLPRDTQGVAAVCHPMPPFVKQNLDVIHRMLLSCRELAMDPRFHMFGIAAACLEAPAPEYEVHDLMNEDDDGLVGVQQEQNIGGMELTSHLQRMSFASKPDIQMFYTDNNSGRVSGPSGGVVQLFLPPYDRHSKYRILAQHEEIRELREKEAKIAAISKGNELIQTELLNKLQTVKEQVEKEQSETNNTSNVAEPSTSKQANETVDNEKHKNKKDKKKNKDKNKTNEDGQKLDMTTSEPNSGLNTNVQSGNAAVPQTVNNPTNRHQPRPYKYDKSKYAKFRDQKKHKNNFN